MTDLTGGPGLTANSGWKAKVLDLLGASPMIVWLSIVIWVSVVQVAQVPDGPARVVIVAAQCANILFAAVLVVLLAVRHIPVQKAPGWAPRLAGIFGGIAPLIVLLLPRATPSPALTLISSGIMLIGTLGSIVVVRWLGRCFSILPQARGLVTEGPYRFVRHPLYLTELVTVCGLMLEFALPWSLLALAVAFGSQVPRMHFEEKVLSDAFPAYRAYATRTARLIPGVY